MGSELEALEEHRGATGPGKLMYEGDDDDDDMD
jgi:hypothetical protein